MRDWIQSPLPNFCVLLVGACLLGYVFPKPLTFLSAMGMASLAIAWGVFMATVRQDPS